MCKHNYSEFVNEPILICNDDDKVTISFLGTYGLRKDITKAASEEGKSESTWMSEVIRNAIDGVTVGDHGKAIDVPLNVKIKLSVSVE